MTVSDVLRASSLTVAVLVIAGSIYYLETQKPGTNQAPATVHTVTTDGQPMDESDKARMFPVAKEIVSPAGFINTEAITLQELVGDKIVLVDFWTYSCINCQRTLPYLNIWHEKYRDQGLVILGVHTPEFAFEKKRENVAAAVAKYGIQYPVILDNDYGTWRAYGNRYWPRKYLIDIDGYIVYDHIGEGAYEETERKIQELLRERAERKGASTSLSASLAPPTPSPDSLLAQRTPELYFGAARNDHLGNGQSGVTGQQEFMLPMVDDLHALNLSGRWDIQPEYAAASAAKSSVRIRYRARDVHIVAGADQPVTLTVTRDGAPLGTAAGADVAVRDSGSTVTVQAEQLYTLVQDTSDGEHVLEITAEEPGVRLFTFTFG